MINIRPDEITSIIQEQIEQYDEAIKVNNIGTFYKLVMGSLVFMDLSK